MSVIPGVFTVRMLRQFLDEHDVPPIDRVAISQQLGSFPDEQVLQRPFVLETVFGGSEKLMRWLIVYDWASITTSDDRIYLSRAKGK